VCLCVRESLTKKSSCRATSLGYISLSLSLYIFCCINMDLESGKRTGPTSTSVGKVKGLSGRLFRGFMSVLLFICIASTIIWMFGKVSMLWKGVEISWNGTLVVPLASSNFTSFIMNTDKDVLVNFYAPWCPHCQQFAPDYIQTAKLLENNTNIVLAAIDAWKFHQVGEKYHIRGFPTVLLFLRSKKEAPIEYAGWKRNVDNLIAFVQSHQDSSTGKGMP